MRVTLGGRDDSEKAHLPAQRVLRTQHGEIAARPCAIPRLPLYPSSASISPRSCSGFVVGAWRGTTLPLRSARNLVKFHLIPLPISPVFSRFRCLKIGSASLPLTLIFAITGKVTA